MPHLDELPKIIQLGLTALGPRVRETYARADVELLEVVLRRLVALDLKYPDGVRREEGLVSLLLMVAVECRNRLRRSRQVLPIGALSAVVGVGLMTGQVAYNIAKYLGLEQIALAVWVVVVVVVLLLVWTVLAETRSTQQWPRIQEALKAVAAAGGKRWTERFQRVLELDEFEMRNLPNLPRG